MLQQVLSSREHSLTLSNELSVLDMIPKSYRKSWGHAFSFTMLVFKKININRIIFIIN